MNSFDCDSSELVDLHETNPWPIKVEVRLFRVPVSRR
jgi:hypothetical protein